MAHKILFKVDDVEQDSAEKRISSLGIVIYKDIFQFIELRPHVVMIDRELRDAISLILLAAKESLHISEHLVILIGKMTADIGYIIVEKLYQEERHLISFGIIDSLDDLLTDLGEGYLDERGMSALKILNKSRQRHRICSELFATQ